MKPTEAMGSRSRKKTNSLRIVLGVAVVGILFLITSIRGLAGFYTDYLWFDSLGFVSIWKSVLWAKFLLGAVFTAVFFLLLWLNLYIADKLAPKVRAPGPEDELAQKWQSLMGRKVGLIRGGISAVFALVAGVGVSAQWEDWLFFSNRVDFNVVDQ